MEASEHRLRAMLLRGKENYPIQNETVELKQREHCNSSREVLVEESQNMLLLMNKLRTQTNGNTNTNTSFKNGSDKVPKLNLCYQQQQRFFDDKRITVDQQQQQPLKEENLNFKKKRQTNQQMVIE